MLLEQEIEKQKALKCQCILKEEMLEKEEKKRRGRNSR
jgi:hypothetical protein